MSINYINRSSFSYFSSLLIALAPVFSNYVLFGPISIGDFFVFLSVPWLCATFKFTHLNIIVIVISVIIVLFSFFCLYGDDLYVGFYRLVFYYVIFFFICAQKNVDFSTFYKVYIYLSIFFSLSIILQWMVYTFIGISFPLQLPIPFYEPDTLNVIDHVFRSGGWFKEPSYFILYVTPLFFYLIQAHRYLLFSILSLAGILSTSSLFFFIFLLSCAFAFIKTFLAFFCFLGSLILLSVTIYIFYDDLVGWIFFSRLVDIFQSGGTLNDRFSPAFDIIALSQSPLPNKLAYDLVVNAGDTGSVWYSSFSSLLAALGWLGVSFLVLNFMRLGLVYGFVLFALMLTSHIFSGVHSVFIALAFLGIKRASKTITSH